VLAVEEGAQNMRKIALSLALMLSLFGLAACSGKGGAASASGNDKVKIATINLLTFSPVWVAEKLGYFKDEGLDVTIVPTNSGDASVQAMLGGSVQAAATGFATPIELTSKGQAIQLLAGLEMATIYTFVGGKDFPQIPADDPQAFVKAMKGKKFGVAASGSTGDTIARGIFSEYGLDPDKDVKITAVGVGAQATAALKAGAVDALVSYEPDVTKMVQSGVGHVVFDLRTTKNETTFSHLPTSAFQATKKWIDGHKDTAAKLVRAITRANDVLREDPATALPVLEKLYPDLSADAVENIYAAAQGHFSSAITEDTYAAAIKIYKQAGVTKEDVPYTDVVATQFTSDWSN